MKAYVIGVKGNHRNPSLTTEISALGLDVVVDDGFVDVSGVVESEVNEKVFLLIRGRRPQLTEIACAKAHLNAWRYLVDTGEASMMVFEDDAILIDEQGFRTVLLESKELKGPWITSLERRPGDYLISHLLRRPGRLRKSLIQPTGACAYIISREAAQLGLSYFRDKGGRIDGLSDFWPGPAALIRWHIAVPPVVAASTSVNSLIGYSTSQNRKISKLRAMALLLITKPYDDVLIKGGFLLLIAKPIKYLLSIHFFTAWITNRNK